MYQLVARYHANECSEKEKAFIERKMHKDDQFRVLVKETQEIWQHDHLISEFNSVEFAWQKLHARIRHTQKPKQRHSFNWNISDIFSLPALSKRAFGFAMIVMLIVSGSIILYNYTDFFIKTEQIVYKTITVDFGEKTQIEMSDGTLISLDAGSSLKYPTVYSDKREFWLTGEAYFQVSHDPNRLFLVHADHAVVKVLGTKFNVRSWKDNKSVTVTVTEGKVLLNREYETSDKSIIIPEGKMSRLPVQGKPTPPKVVNVDNHLSWLKNEIRLENVRLREVLSQLTRWYNFQFNVDDPNLYDLKMTVHIRKTNVDDVLKLISLITHTEIKRDNLAIHLLRKVSN
jgi:transmembrane sensor